MTTNVFLLSLTRLDPPVVSAGFTIVQTSLVHQPSPISILEESASPDLPDEVESDGDQVLHADTVNSRNALVRAGCDA